MIGKDNAVLQVKNIVKEFPGVTALKGVDLNVYPGEIHGLVGENGAGKSTLIKIISGLYQPTDGEIIINGKITKNLTPKESNALGISVIAQEFNLIPQMTIVENLFLGKELKQPTGNIDWKHQKEKARKILEKVGLNISVDLEVEFLSVADQQLVEIARALLDDANLLIMDEPTASLNISESERLIDIIKDLKASGTSILYISHRLNEIFEITDRVTVFRDGKHIINTNTLEITENELITHMIGKELKSLEINHQNILREEKFRVNNLNIPNKLNDISFEVFENEILGIAGLIGSGRRELSRALFGLENSAQVDAYLYNNELDLSTPVKALKEKIYMLTEDRKEEGIIPDFDVLNNIVISKPRKKAEKVLINSSKESDIYERTKNFFNIKTYDSSQSIKTLSGGNQQKVLLGRSMASKCEVLILNEPTRGVDIGAKTEIYKKIRELADEGVSIIVSSSDPQELVQLVDRCLVLNSGDLVSELQKDDLSEDTILTASLKTKKEGV